MSDLRLVLVDDDDVVVELETWGYSEEQAARLLLAHEEGDRLQVVDVAIFAAAKRLRADLLSERRAERSA